MVFAIPINPIPLRPDSRTNISLFPKWMITISVILKYTVKITKLWLCDGSVQICAEFKTEGGQQGNISSACCIFETKLTYGLAHF